MHTAHRGIYQCLIQGILLVLSVCILYRYNMVQKHGTKLKIKFIYLFIFLQNSLTSLVRFIHDVVD